MLPPGPRTPGLWQTFRFITDPLSYSRKMIARYGDVIRVRVANGAGVAVSSPELARLVFSSDPDTFEPISVAGEIFGMSAVIATSGATHRRQRKLLNPRFHGTRVRAFLTTMQRVASEHLGALDRAAASGEIVRMVDVGQALALDVILETVFGESPSLVRDQSRVILRALIHGVAPALFATPLLRSTHYPPWRRLLAARANFDAWVDGLIAERRAAPSLGGDLLGLLLEARYEDGSVMANAEIRDQLLTLLLAGHETSAVAMAWGVYWLTHEPAVLARLRGELDALGPEPAPEAVVRSPYLQAVCSESLRIEPVVTDVARVCKAPFSLGPYTVPAGDIVFVNMTAILRDDRVFPEAHRFRPERFLERSFGPGEFVPFGGGARRCLGAAFAEAELAIVLAAVAREWDLELAGPRETSVRRNITMGPKHGVRVRVRGRRMPSV